MGTEISKAVDPVGAGRSIASQFVPPLPLGLTAPPTEVKDGLIAIPQGVTRMKFRLVGGGGAGGNVYSPAFSSTSIGGGGGAGATVNATFRITPGMTYTLTTGRGGKGERDGSASTASSITRSDGVVIATAGGGSQGGVGMFPPGTGGDGGNAVLNETIEFTEVSINVQKGGNGMIDVFGESGSGGKGADTPLSRGGAGATFTTPAGNGGAPGAGGGGGFIRGVGERGGDGGDGVATVVWE